MSFVCPSKVDLIERTECIGNSLTKINGNFKNLDDAVCVLENQGINTINSSTINLTYNNSTKSLSANVVSFALPTTKTYNMFTTIGAVTWGAAYESTNPAFPGGTSAIYNNTKFRPMSADTFNLTYNSVIHITDVAYWNYDGGTGLIFIWQTYDYSLDGGATWIDMATTSTGSVKVLQGTSYYGAPVDNGGGSGTGSACLTAAAGVSIKFRPKYRFQKPTGSPTSITNMIGNGSHIITIEPI